MSGIKRLIVSEATISGADANVMLTPEKIANYNCDDESTESAASEKASHRFGNEKME